MQSRGPASMTIMMIMMIYIYICKKKWVESDWMYIEKMVKMEEKYIWWFVYLLRYFSMRKKCRICALKNGSTKEQLVDAIQSTQILHPHY